MDSNYEIKITFKNKRAIFKYIVYSLYIFFVVPIQLFLYNFRKEFGKSKIYKKVSKVKIVVPTLFSIFWAIVFSFLVYWVELMVGVEEDGIFILPGMVAFLILFLKILHFTWVIVVRSMEFLVTFVLSLIETILELTTEKVYK